MYAGTSKPAYRSKSKLFPNRPFLLTLALTERSSWVTACAISGSGGREAITRAKPHPSLPTTLPTRPMTPAAPMKTRMFLSWTLSCWRSWVIQAQLVKHPSIWILTSRPFWRARLTRSCWNCQTFAKLKTQTQWTHCFAGIKWKKDPRSYLRNVSSCEKKDRKNLG